MWDSEYISEIEYLYGYYSELSPVRLKLALLSRGIQHSVGSYPTYLELGFGQGLSLNINAAVTSGAFYGTDFNPGQAAHANDLSMATGKDIKIFDDSFEDLASRTDLPEFDIIALHGIWSWVSDDSRAAIVDIISKKLKIGGILYISYNVTPGWSPAVPLRHLMSEYAKRSATGGILSRVEQSIAFVDGVMNADAAYFAANPSLRTRLEQIKNSNKSYIAHEYFNTFWDPMPFSQIADILDEAKLTFGASASILENIDAISVPQKARDTLNKISDPILRETTKDYFLNQQFRRDIFVKGPRRLTEFELGRQILSQSFICIADKKSPPKQVKTSLGGADLIPAIYDPITSFIASTAKTEISIGDILRDKRCKSLTKWQVWEALLILTAEGYLAPVATSETPQEDLRASRNLNREICRKAESSESMNFLAAPKIGMAMPVNRIQQLFLHALNLEKKNIPEYVWEILKAQNQNLLVANKTLERPEDNLKHLKEMYKDFSKNVLPVLKIVGAI